MFKVVFLDMLVFPPGTRWRKFNFKYEAVEYPYTNNKEQLLERCKDADVVITSKVVFDREILATLAKCKLKLIQITATGKNNVDLEAAKEFNIAVQNVEDYSSDSVAEMNIGFMFALAKSYNGWIRDSITNTWSEQPVFCYFDYPIYDLKGKTLGIVGKGNIGKRTGELASALGVKVIYAERPGQAQPRPGYVVWEEFLAQADFVSLSCPLDNTNQGLFNKETFALMKPNSFLINCSRGGLVNEQDLVDAIVSKQLAGAALDVLSVEPPSKDNVLLNLAKVNPNIIIVPHLAFAGEKSLEILKECSIKYVEDFVATLDLKN